MNPSHFLSDCGSCEKRACCLEQLPICRIVVEILYNIGKFMDSFLVKLYIEAKTTDLIRRENRIVVTRGWSEYRGQMEVGQRVSKYGSTGGISCIL